MEKRIRSMEKKYSKKMDELKKEIAEKDKRIAGETDQNKNLPEGSTKNKIIFGSSILTSLVILLAL
jgi:phage host-nuclease inhibitor protein Gam